MFFWHALPAFGSNSCYLAGPTLDPEAVGRAVADGMVRFRPTIYPLASSQVLAVMNELWPTLMDRTLANLRADVSQGPYTSRVKGSHRNESETPPRAQIEVQHSQTP